jgi:hypothetical protein
VSIKNFNNVQKLEDFKKGNKIILSNSMVSEFKTCERKFVYNYILNKDADSDHIIPKYFNFGNAYHDILDQTQHDSSKFTMDLLHNVSDKYQLDPVYEKAKLVQCLLLYYKEHVKSGLQIIATEVYFKGSNAGTVDAIAIDKDSNWWIVDLKTAASLSNMRPEMLNVDPQMALYTYHSEDIKKVTEELTGIKLNEFKGIRLREVTKAKERKKKEVEDFDSFYQRLKPIEYRELVLDANYVETEEVKFFMEVESERVQDSLKRFIDGGENIKQVPRNVRNCTDPITKSVCPFFSTCHGKSAYDIMKKEDLDFLDV